MKMENEKAFPEGIPYTKNKPPHQKFWCGVKVLEPRNYQ